MKHGNNETFSVLLSTDLLKENSTTSSYFDFNAFCFEITA